MVNITVLFFASYKSVTGTNQLTLEIPDTSRVSDLKLVLCKRYPALKDIISNALVAVNQEFGFDDDLLPDGCEVALFPPVSGGDGNLITIVKIVTEPLDLDELVAQITFPTTGAACLFTGMVRGQTYRGDAHETAYLEYEAYIPMAETKMKQVADEIRQRWPVIEGIVIVQRIGKLYPKTPTVLIACSAAHRDTGVFEAARYGIDRLKEIVPIWKKEAGAHGEFWVEGDYHPKSGD